MREYLISTAPGLWHVGPPTVAASRLSPLASAAYRTFFSRRPGGSSSNTTSATLLAIQAMRLPCSFVKLKLVVRCFLQASALLYSSSGTQGKLVSACKAVIKVEYPSSVLPATSFPQSFSPSLLLRLRRYASLGQWRSCADQHLPSPPHLRPLPSLRGDCPKSPLRSLLRESHLLSLSQCVLLGRP
jgi:hypothetical protein